MEVYLCSAFTYTRLAGRGPWRLIRSIVASKRSRCVVEKFLLDEGGKLSEGGRKM